MEVSLKFCDENIFLALIFLYITCAPQGQYPVGIGSHRANTPARASKGESKTTPPLIYEKHKWGRGFPWSKIKIRESANFDFIKLFDIYTITYYMIYI